MADTATTSVPTTPTTATTEQVAQHHNVVQSLIGGLEALPQNVVNAEKYLDLKAEGLSSWVQAKHVKTRLLEVAAVMFAIGFLLGFWVGRCL